MTSGKNFRIIKIDETKRAAPPRNASNGRERGRDFFEVFIDPTGPVSARTGALLGRRYQSGIFMPKITKPRR